MKTLCLLVMISVAISFGLQPAIGGEARTTVKHISADAIYLDAGSKDSIQVGDRVTIKRDDKIIAYLEVLFVSRSSASCRLMESAQTLQAGDSAIVLTQDVADIMKEQVNTDTIAPPKPEPRKTKVSVKNNRLTGRLALSSQWSNDLESTNADVAEPSLSARLRLENISGSHLRLELKARFRKIIRSRESASATESQWNNRLYEAALVFDDPQAKLGYRAGRFVANSIAGIGYLDGVMGNYQLANEWKAGAFLGTDPDLRNTDFRSDHVKSGIFLRYEHAQQNKQRAAGTIALAGKYQDGEASREFFYQQLNLAPHNALNIYESAELNVNRGWRKDADGTFLLSSFIFSTTWTPHPKFSADLGYDNRRNFHTYETRTVADSLFDDALRQSIRGGVRVRFDGRFYARATGGLRGLSGAEADAHNLTFAAGNTGIARTQIGFEAMLASYQNEYSDGRQFSVQLRRPLGRYLQASISRGQDDYSIQSVHQGVTQNWLRSAADFTLSRHYYGSLQAEFRRGEGIDQNFYSAELGYRF